MSSLTSCTPHVGRFRAYGVRVEVRASSAALLRRVYQELPPGLTATSAGTVGRVFSVCAPVRRCSCGERHAGWRVARGREAYAVRRREEAVDLLRLWPKQYVAEFSTRYVFVHAGVVWKDGRALLLPGQSMSGKTTLVAALLSAGATYYSDEYAVLDPQGRVWPFTQRLGMRQPGNGPAQRPTAPSALGAGSGVGPAPVAAIVMARYVEGSRWAPQTLSRAEAALALLAHAPAARRAPARVLATLARTAASGVCLSGTRGDANETAALILDYLTSLPR